MSQETFESLLDGYEAGRLDRRQFLSGISAAALGQSRTATPAGVLQTQSLNHVTILTPQVARTTEFYQKLLGLRADVVDPAKRIYLRVPGGSFLSIQAAAKPSVDHFCFGIKGFDGNNPQGTITRLTAAGYQARLADANSAFVTDPDGLLLQLSEPGFTGLEDHPKA
jgi:catechol 2,3-dioxygenase-like lactoylglutathione lyase family enzyme